MHVALHRLPEQRDQLALGRVVLDFPCSVVTQDLGQEILDRPAGPRHDQVWVAQPVLSKYLYGVCGQLVSKGPEIRNIPADDQRTSST
jgi:hypothetical protein